VGVVGEGQTGCFGRSEESHERRGALSEGDEESTRIESVDTRGSEDEGSGPSSASAFRLWWLKDMC